MKSSADTLFFQNRIENVVMNEQKLTLWPSGVLFGVDPESNSPETRKICDYVNHMFVYYIRPTTVICCYYEDLPLFSSSYSDSSM